MYPKSLVLSLANPSVLVPPDGHIWDRSDEI
jgi:hypothetical protein